MTRTGPRVLALIVSLTLFAAACADDAADTDTTTQTATSDTSGTAAPDDERARTLVIAATGNPSGFDGDVFGPNMQNVVVQMNEPLVDYAPPSGEGIEVSADEVVGRLAEDWTVSDDGLTYVFKLREGVLSCAGNELTSEDVVFGWEKSFSQGRTGNFIASVGNVESLEATGTYEVTFHLSAPSPIFTRAITVYTPGIYDSAVLKEHATEDDPYAAEWLQTNFAGFGAYCLESIAPDQQLVFTANPNYYRGEPYFQRVIYQIVPDTSNRVALLQSDQVDIIEEPSFQQLSQLQSDPNVKTYSVAGNKIATVQINANFEPYDDLRVREAVAYAIDDQAIADSVFLGLGEVAKSPIPPSYPFSTDEFWHYEVDYDRARDLLDEAGYPDGLDVELFYANNNPWEEAVAIAVRDSLANAGINATLTKLTNEEAFARTAPGDPPTRDVPFFVWMDFALVMDPGYTLFLNSVRSGSADRNDYDNDEFEELVLEANATLDPDTRRELLVEAQRIVVQDVSWAHGILFGNHEAMGPDIEGYLWYPDGHERWFELSRSSS